MLTRFRYTFQMTNTGAQLGLMDVRWPDLANFEQLEPSRFYLRQNPEHS
jgi:hypothetical protein